MCLQDNYEILEQNFIYVVYLHIKNTYTSMYLEISYNYI